MFSFAFSSLLLINPWQNASVYSSGSHPQTLSSTSSSFLVTSRSISPFWFSSRRLKPPHSHAPSSATPSPDVTAPRSNTQPEPHPTPTAVNQAEINLEAPVESPPTRLEPGPPVSRSTTCPPLHIQSTPNTTSTPQYQQQTYASVLQQPTTSSPQPTPRPQPTPPNPTLTIEDLRRCFHNKPSPFNLERKEKKGPKTYLPHSHCPDS